jgi:NADPH-dependent 2,4-dienoyl-CoA reductase/sulfur reductase-like enzyme
VPDALVVGSGQSGLLAAKLLAEHGVATIVIERLPAPGGQEPEHPLADELAAEAVSAGVSLLLGTLAVQWDGEFIRTLGVRGASRLRSDALIIATGTRPATRGELGIAGDRCAGIVPGSAAVHLIQAGVLLGRRPAVFGAGDLAATCVRLLLRAGADEVTLVTPEPFDAPPLDRVRVLEGWRVVSVHGTSRVEKIVVDRDGAREAFTADALVLASGRVPMRNVEGAVVAVPHVFFCHSSADPKRLDDAHATASAVVAAVLDELARGIKSIPAHEME